VFEGEDTVHEDHLLTNAEELSVMGVQQATRGRREIEVSDGLKGCEFKKGQTAVEATDAREIVVPHRKTTLATSRIQRRKRNEAGDQQTIRSGSPCK